MRTPTLVLTLTMAMTTSLSVAAFPFLRSWHDPADGNVAGSVRAGAGDIYGTGSTQDWGIKCSHCHIESEGSIAADFAVSPAWLDINGESGYVPDQLYTITVTMLGEHRGLDNPEVDDNLNGVAVAIEDAAGDTAGVYYADSGVDSANCPASAPPNTEPSLISTYVYGDCHGVLFTEERQLTSWTFDWLAPSAGAGNLTLFYGMVDGSSHGDSSLDDDVKEGTLTLVEGN